MSSTSKPLAERLLRFLVMDQLSAGSAVQEKLRHAQQIQATSAAFAANLDNCCVVTWGHPDAGCDSSNVQGQLRNVQQIQAHSSAFAAVLRSDFIVTWGCNGDGSHIQEQRSVRQTQSSGGAFAAILRDSGCLGQP